MAPTGQKSPFELRGEEIAASAMPIIDVRMRTCDVASGIYRTAHGESVSIGVSFNDKLAGLYVEMNEGSLLLRMNGAGLDAHIERLTGLRANMDRYFYQPYYRIETDTWAIPQRDGSFVECAPPKDLL
jgi:hypothetical protein